MTSSERFKVSFTGSSADLLKKISNLLKNNNGSISGSETGGTFSVPVPVFGNIAGVFSVEGQFLTIQVKERPFFLPSSTIESYIKTQIQNLESAEIAET